MNSALPKAALSRSAAIITDAPTVKELLGAVSMPHPRFGLERPERARRILNVVGAAIALVLCAPLMFLIAVLILLTSRGPVLYTQTRVGLNRRHASSLDGRRRINYGGKLFKIYKFRTMRVDADKHGEVWARPADPRVTPIGRILRNYRLDELPQLVNVLKGDMNIVGPRPEQPKIFVNMRGEIEHYSKRQRVLPGITGLAQIRHHYGSSIDDVRNKLNYDLQYIARRSCLEDVKVLVQTVPVVVYKKGAW
jgi:lipopolysaccharide/colanic/teichoic acid biosynthesis glycosyltransferase